MSRPNEHGPPREEGGGPTSDAFMFSPVFEDISSLLRTQSALFFSSPVGGGEEESYPFPGARLDAGGSGGGAGGASGFSPAVGEGRSAGVAAPPPLSALPRKGSFTGEPHAFLSSAVGLGNGSGAGAAAGFAPSRLHSVSSEATSTSWLTHHSDTGGAGTGYAVLPPAHVFPAVPAASPASPPSTSHRQQPLQRQASAPVSLTSGSLSAESARQSRTATGSSETKADCSAVHDGQSNAKGSTSDSKRQDATSQSSSHSNGGITEVFDPEFKFIFDVPSSCVVHLPPARLNITRLVLCRNYAAGEPGSCGMGHSCKFVHADCCYEQLESHPIHVNYIWRSERLCTYTRLSENDDGCGALASLPLTVLEADGSTTELPPDRVLVTAGAITAARHAQRGADMQSRTAPSTTAESEREKQVEEGSEGPAASAAVPTCLSYDDDGMCLRGPSCPAVHRITVDPAASSNFKRAPRKGKATAVAAAATAVASNEEAAACPPLSSSGEAAGGTHATHINGTHAKTNATAKAVEHSPTSLSAAPALHARQEADSGTLQAALVPAPVCRQDVPLPDPRVVPFNNFNRNPQLLPLPHTQHSHLLRGRAHAGSHPHSNSGGGASFDDLGGRFPFSWTPTDGSSSSQGSKSYAAHGGAGGSGGPDPATLAFLSSLVSGNNLLLHQQLQQQLQLQQQQPLPRNDNSALPAFLQSHGPPPPHPQPQPQPQQLTISLPLDRHTIGLLTDVNSAGTLLYLPRGSAQAVPVWSVPSLDTAAR